MKFAFLAAGALALGNPVAAQDSQIEQSNAEKNLDCAIWASYAVGSATDDKTRRSLSIALGWFIGLYEGEAGVSIDDAFVERTPELSVLDMTTLGPTCRARFQAFGARIGGLSARISALEEQ